MPNETYTVPTEQFFNKFSRTDELIVRNNELLAQLLVKLGATPATGPTINIPVEPTDSVKKFTVANVLLTTANTEYQWQIPQFVKRFVMQTRGGEAVRLSDVQGKVAGSVTPYFTLKANGFLSEEWVRVENDTTILYMASPNASVTVEILLEI
jgi:hypothetical protein